MLVYSLLLVISVTVFWLFDNTFSVGLSAVTAFLDSDAVYMLVSSLLLVGSVSAFRLFNDAFSVGPAVVAAFPFALLLFTLVYGFPAGCS